VIERAGGWIRPDSGGPSQEITFNENRGPRDRNRTEQKSARGEGGGTHCEFIERGGTSLKMKRPKKFSCLSLEEEGRKVKRGGRESSAKFLIKERDPCPAPRKALRSF